MPMLLHLRLIRIAATLVAIILAPAAWAQHGDALGIPGPLAFEDTSYEFAWANSDGKGFYIQEYVPAGQKVETYTDMFLIQLIGSAPSPEAMATAMVKELDARKGTDPVVNHQIIRNANTGEVLLDFLISDTSANPIVVEWNAYRYVSLEAGTALFAISRRAYGNDGATAFLSGLKQWRPATIGALAQMALPPVTIAP